MIKGIDIILINEIEVGLDDVNRPLYSDRESIVHNVLVGEPSTEDVTNELNLSGKLVKYTLALPKGDKNDWTNAKVILPPPFEGIYRVVGTPTAGIEANIPLLWNKKVRLEAYE